MSIDNNNYRNMEQDRRLIEMEKSLKIVNKELGDVRADIIGIASTQKIILAFIMMIFAGLVGLFLK